MPISINLDSVSDLNANENVREKCHSCWCKFFPKLYYAYTRATSGYSPLYFLLPLRINFTHFIELQVKLLLVESLFYT